MKNNKISIGDLIHQIKDNIIFLVVEKNRKNYKLQPFRMGRHADIAFVISRSRLQEEFNTRGEFLIHYRILK